MKVRVLGFAVAMLAVATPSIAHRLNEYLQATTIGLDGERLNVQLRLTPGVDIVRNVLADIDMDADGVLSEPERQAYADRVRRDVSLSVDDRSQSLRLVSSSFEPIDRMTSGQGEIVLLFEADGPRGGGPHTVSLVNHHWRAVAAYLVNVLQPRDEGLHIDAQHRSYDQSEYRVDFRLDSRSSASSPRRPERADKWRAAMDALAVVRTYFWHGAHHILTGYDHLLFLGALVLAATTLWDLVLVVTAFTVAHSLTLTLATLDIVRLPQRFVEPVIAASIVCVGLQNIFWPRHSRGYTRLTVAFVFGLFHGLGFAGGLLDVMQDMPTATIGLAIVGFSIGVEAGNQVVLLPIFALMKAARLSRADNVLNTRVSLAIDRIGSAAIAVAGVYYLGASVAGLI
jgi:hydrogenase/urease accessory protein HupE